MATLNYFSIFLLVAYVADALGCLYGTAAQSYRHHNLNHRDVSSQQSQRPDTLQSSTKDSGRRDYIGIACAQNNGGGLLQIPWCGKFMMMQSIILFMSLLSELTFCISITPSHP
jgi:hypothetical protein